MHTIFRSALLSLFIAGTGMQWFSENHISAGEPVRIVMVGDSTMASYSKPPEDRPDLTGWGQVFGEFFDGDVQIFNHAVSGRSSRNFRTEGHWQKALDRKPDYIFIQFGHNDRASQKERFSDPETDFRTHLKEYVQESRDAGAKPILITPVAVRSLKEGKVVDSLQPYVEATLIVAKETETPVIDLHKLSVEAFEKIGEPAGQDLNPKPIDHTHFSRKGAQLVAGLVASELPSAEPTLAKRLLPEPMTNAPKTQPAP